MAATVSSIKNVGSIGSVTLLRIIFSEIDDADTYASGINGVVDFWFNRTDDPTQGTEGVGVSESSGTFTFNCGEDDITGTLFVLKQDV